MEMWGFQQITLIASARFSLWQVCITSSSTGPAFDAGAPSCDAAVAADVPPSEPPPQPPIQPTSPTSCTSETLCVSAPAAGVPVGQPVVARLAEAPPPPLPTATVVAAPAARPAVIAPTRRAPSVARVVTPGSTPSGSVQPANTGVTGRGIFAALDAAGAPRTLTSPFASMMEAPPAENANSSATTPPLNLTIPNVALQASGGVVARRAAPSLGSTPQLHVEPEIAQGAREQQVLAQNLTPPASLQERSAPSRSTSPTQVATASTPPPTPSPSSETPPAATPAASPAAVPAASGSSDSASTWAGIIRSVGQASSRYNQGQQAANQASQQGMAQFAASLGASRQANGTAVNQLIQGMLEAGQQQHALRMQEMMAIATNAGTQVRGMVSELAGPEVLRSRPNRSLRG